MKYRHALILVFLIIILDQWSKIYVKTHFHYNEEVMVIGDWFRLHFLENEGMAFGMKFSENAIGKLVLSLFRLVAVFVGFGLLKKLVDKGYKNGAIICGSLVLAGAAGNLIDSAIYGKIFTESHFHIASLVPWGQGYGDLFHGKVVDMLYFPLIDTFWPDWVPYFGGKPLRFFEPVFNIADVAISTGVITFAVFQNKLLQKKNTDFNAEQNTISSSVDHE